MACLETSTFFIKIDENDPDVKIMQKLKLVPFTCVGIIAFIGNSVTLFALMPYAACGLIGKSTVTNMKRIHIF